jgi:hypothetical protein
MKTQPLRTESPFKNRLSKKESSKEMPLLPAVSKSLMRSASGPIARGKLVRGNNFDGEKLLCLKKAKVEELEAKLEA